MDIGIPKEIQRDEFRVGLAPAGVVTLVHQGHRVYVQTEAGAASGFTDEQYRKAGAEVVYSAQEVYSRAQMILKVAAPAPPEYPLIERNQMLFGFLHLAVAPRELIDALSEREVEAIAYETIEGPDGRLPVLLPTSEIAGRITPQIAASLLDSTNGGKGVLLSGVPGVPPAQVVILGGGVVGSNAARAFVGLGVHVTVLDHDLRVLQRLDRFFDGRVMTMMANDYTIARAASYADVLIGAVLVHGARAPHLVTREMVRTMKPKSVIIDIAVDQGGCVETSHPTHHSAPTFIEEGVIHYCVPNIPSKVARTATHALTNSALSAITRVAASGLVQTTIQDPGFAKGINICSGALTNEAVALAHGRKARTLSEVL